MSADDISKSDVYEQDCEFARYHDGLMWGRFGTAAAIEAAILYGRFQVGFLPVAYQKAFLICGAVLVFLCCVLTFVNRGFSKMHLRRVKEAEEKSGVRFDREQPYLPAEIFLWPAAIILNVSNVWIISGLFCGSSCNGIH